MYNNCAHVCAKNHKELIAIFRERVKSAFWHVLADHIIIIIIDMNNYTYNIYDYIYMYIHLY